MNAPTDAARAAISSLLAGGTLPSDQPDYGPWGEVISQLATAAQVGGVEAVNIAFQTAARAERGLIELMATAATKPKRLSGMPPLPPELAQLLDGRQQRAGAWLDQYVAYASQASPVTPRRFHEAAGLYAVATAIARRLVFQIGPASYYPNIYALFVAPPGRYAKSTAMKILDRLIRRADLGYLLLPESITPQGLMQQMSLVVHDKVAAMVGDDKDEWIRQRAQAAQRAWLIDEAGFLFGDLKKDYMAALLGLILKFFDAPEQLTYETISHGKTTIRNASLSFFGATTPKNIEAHLRDEKLWDEGLWSRFALIVPDGQPVYGEFPDHPLDIPSELVEGLQRIDALFPMPRAELVEEAESGHQYIRVYNEQEAQTVGSTADVVRVWKAYDKALRFDLPQSGLEETLYASYTRFPSQVIKVAMILATMDAQTAPVIIELRHMLRAIRIVEGWRADLHKIWSEGLRTEETKTGDRILALLAESAPAGCTARELCIGTRKTAREVKDVLEVLRLAGHVTPVDTKATNGRTVQVWTLISRE